MLDIRDLTVDFGSAPHTSRALHGISFRLNRGEIVAVVGESGSGKSVTSLSILRLIPAPPASYPLGAIIFTPGGPETATDLLQLDHAQLQAIRGKKIAMIFQEPMSSLNPVFTCGKQVMEAILQHENINAAQARQRTIELFEKVKLPDPPAIFDRYPHQLSGGQKQRVMIAMAMSCSPDLLICDEPTTALDVTVQKTILLLIKELQQQFNMGVIFITHDLGVVGEIANRVVVMYKGRIVEQDTAKNIFTNPQHPYTKALLACRPVLHNKNERLPVVSDFMDVLPDGSIVEKATAPVKTFHEAGIAPTGSAAPLLAVKDLRVWYPTKKNIWGKAKDHFKAVDGVSFAVYPGETLGLVGESGCGKTTLGRSILRLIEPTAGEIYFKDQPLRKLDDNQLRALRRDMQIIFQDPFGALNPRIKIGDAIAEPLLVHGIVKDQKAAREKVISLLEKVNLLPDHYNRYPHEFSGGQRQRIVIARTLALNPSFIICDESVSALDVSVQAQVLNLLNDLKKEFGFTAIFISHDLGVVRYICDRIMVMQKGKIEESGIAEEIYHNPQSAYTQRLIAAIPKVAFEG